MRIDPAKDVVRVDGERIPTDPTRRYVVLNKPAGVITTRRDPQGRTTVIDVAGITGLYPVGRLDAATEGLLLLTNDGELAHRLMHPSHGVEKVYLAEVEGRMTRRGAARLVEEGIAFEKGRPARAVRARIVQASPSAKRTLVEVVVHEGRKHVVRKMLAACGHPVTKLSRVAVGPIKLGRLGSGARRDLTPGEVAALYRAVGL